MTAKKVGLGVSYTSNICFARRPEELNMSSPILYVILARWCFAVVFVSVHNLAMDVYRLVYIMTRFVYMSKAPVVYIFTLLVYVPKTPVIYN